MPMSSSRDVQLTSNSRLVFLTLLALLLLGLMTTGCIRSVDRGVWASGRILEMNVKKIQKVDHVAYTDRGKHYVVRTDKPGHFLTVAQVTIRNEMASRVLLKVDQEAAYLEDQMHQRYLPVDPFTQREEIKAPLEGQDTHIPLLWRNIELPLDFQLSGWLIFEVPEDAELLALQWSQGDRMRADISSY
jgi:hypothetical protein